MNVERISDTGELPDWAGPLLDDEARNNLALGIPGTLRTQPARYTPPEARGHDYASALVAHVSAELLASGRRFCFLYTNLANRASNKIYAELGYEPVCDSRQIEFTP